MDHSALLGNPIATSSAVHPPPLDLELLSIKSSQAYTSLKDVLPAVAAVNSPRVGYEISIRNRLVKQAAWAYLQPMSASPSYYSSTGHFHCLCCQFSGRNPVTACISFINRYIIPAFTWVFDRVLRALGVSINR